MLLAVSSSTSYQSERTCSRRRAQAGGSQLRLGGGWLHRTPGNRIARRQREGADDTRPVQGRRERSDRSRGWPDPGDGFELQYAGTHADGRQDPGGRRYFPAGPPAFAGLPPLAASVPGYAIDIWVGVFAPAGTPAPTVDRLNREINDIAASPEMRVVLEPDGRCHGDQPGFIRAAHEGGTRPVEADRDRSQDRRRITVFGLARRAVSLGDAYCDFLISAGLGGRCADGFGTAIAPCKVIPLPKV